MDRLILLLPAASAFSMEGTRPAHHAEDERKPLHLKSQGSPDQCHDHIKVRLPHWTSWRSLEQQGWGGASHWTGTVEFLPGG